MAPQRVVSLCPSITETLVSIGARPALVGATRFCVRPQGMLWGLPRVGGTKSPDLSRVMDLRPDLVFANEEENRREDVEALRRHGVAVDVSFPKRVADVPPLVRRWGKLLEGESEAQADALASRIEEAIEANRPASMPFRYAYWIWKDPWMTISDDTYVADLLRLAGGINAYGGEESRYPKSSPREALARQVDVHLFPSEPYPFRPERHEDALRRLFGGGPLFFVSGDDYCWHGARTLDGLAASHALRTKLGVS